MGNQSDLPQATKPHTIVEANPSSQSLSQPSKTNENHLYIVRYIYFFTMRKPVNREVFPSWLLA